MSKSPNYDSVGRDGISADKNLMTRNECRGSFSPIILITAWTTIFSYAEGINLYDTVMHLFFYSILLEINSLELT